MLDRDFTTTVQNKTILKFQGGLSSIFLISTHDFSRGLIFLILDKCEILHKKIYFLEINFLITAQSKDALITINIKQQGSGITDIFIICLYSCVFASAVKIIE